MKRKVILPIFFMICTAAMGNLKPAVIKHVVVCQEPGRFAGWPANNGRMLVWGDEIVFGFSLEWYKANERGHSIDQSKPSEHLQGRSLDGGETWTIEKPKYTRNDEQALPSPGGINFAHPDFAMHISGERFLISYDRAKSWDGPYNFTPFGMELTSRTDYMTVSKDECMVFLSANLPEVTGSNHPDRSFMARTRDGGKSFQFVSWLTGEPVNIRAAMPSTVRTSATRLVTITRRKVRNMETKKYSNWLEASVSEDNGESWKYLCKVVDTDRGEQNGNPPALVRLRDGRLAIAYGYRSNPLGMRAKISKDGGASWGEEIILRDDAGSWDMGYPRMAQRADGKLVTVYYYNTAKNPEPYLTATIWDPNSLMSIGGVEWDKSTWYINSDAKRLFVNSDGDLEWTTPKGDDQFIARIPTKRLSQPGDVVEKSYMFMSDGEHDCNDCLKCPGCFDSDITCLAGTSDIRVGLFESVPGDNDLDNFKGYKGYNYRFGPNMMAGPTRWVDCTKETHKTGMFGKKPVSANDLMSKNSGLMGTIPGFELPPGEYSYFNVRLERLSASSIKLAITLNNRTITYIDDSSKDQPEKINLFAVSMRNNRPFTRVVLRSIKP